eukprot:42221-Rhodomonas_salina.1
MLLCEVHRSGMGDGKCGTEGEGSVQRVRGRDREVREGTAIGYGEPLVGQAFAMEVRYWDR